MVKTAEIWQKNLKILWLGNLITGMGASMCFPFLPLYIQTLGDFTTREISFYSSLAFSITFVTQAIAAPLWGKLADRVGRKPMLLRSAIGIVIASTLGGFAPNVWFLLAMRALQGVFSGYTGNAIALMSSQVPHERSGQVLGTLGTGSVTGQLLGPLIGGVVAQHFSYRVPFITCGVLMLLTTILTIFYVSENFVPVVATGRAAKEPITAYIWHSPLLLAMIASTLLIQAAVNSANPVMSIFIGELMQHSDNVPTVTGVVAALPGIAAIVSAPLLGKLSDRIGPKRILMVGLLVCASLFLPMAFTVAVWQFALLRFAVGITDGALLPVTQTVLTQNTAPAVLSRVFSYNQSAQALGSVVGPMLAALVSGVFDVRYVFLMTATLVATNFLVVTLAYRKQQRSATHAS